MAHVMLICGKICSGKSRYAQRLRERHDAVVLSCDELMFAMGLEDIGQAHDAILARATGYLFTKAAQIVAAGVDVVLDFGFWSPDSRRAAREFFAERGVEARWHYIDVSQADWERNLRARNRAVEAGATGAYYVDEGLLEKCIANFTPPERAEMDVWVKSADAMGGAASNGSNEEEHMNGQKGTQGKELTISDMTAMQRELWERYRDKWSPLEPAFARNSLLWMMGEVGEVIEIIKKSGEGPIMEDAAVRAAFVEELCDVLMYLNDALLRYGITGADISAAYRRKHEKNMHRDFDEEERVFTRGL